MDFNDLVVLAQHYNTALPAPGAAVPAVSATPAMAFPTAWAAALATPPAPLKPLTSAKAKPKPVFSVIPVAKQAPPKPKPALRR